MPEVHINNGIMIWKVAAGILNLLFLSGKLTA